ncbi:MAG: hypothetical protein CVV49_19555 [Spirochaetae bacterium HGW-Spirochaetae-5]|nr:MAG: hypothetical protein CVV49_19555 [Spirochaetae bacterium HGW-Spirochaetae-5]
MNSEAKKNILLVEDEAVIAITEKMQLEKKGYIVHPTSTGEKAVQTIIDNIIPVDLILMDIDLGSGIDGTEAAAQILNHKDIPVVFLSSHSEPEVVEKTEKITSYGYVVKNSGIVVLDASIKMAIKLFDEKKEHKLKEVALQKSEQRFYELFEKAPLGYQSLDSDGKFLAVNEAWLGTLGYKLEEVVGKWFGDFLAPEYVQTFKERFPLFKAQGQIHSEFYMLHKNGNRVYIAFDGRIGYNPDGSFQKTHCILRDDTERKRTEEALKAKNEEFESTNEELTAAMEEMEAANEELIAANNSVQQADESLRKSEAIKNKMVSNIGDVIVIIDENGINKYKSPNITKLFGWTPEELVGENTWYNIHPDDLEAGQSFFSTILTEPDAVGTTEMRYKRKDGDYVWIEISVINLLQDKDIQGILGNYHDITERKQAEDALERTIYELKKSQEVAKVGNWVWYISQNRVEWSDEMYRIFGIDKKQFTGDLSQVISNCIHPDDQAEVLRSNTSVMEQNTPIPVEYRIIRPDGNVRTVWAEAGELELDKTGKPMLLRGIIHDITERKQAGEEIQKQLREKETLLREIHHRVKNNIGNIEGFLILQDEATNNPEAKSAIKSAIVRVQSMRILYDKLLLSKDLHEISMKEYIEDLIDSLHDVFDKKDMIIIEKQISNFSILSKQAVTIGIIINELLTNVYKYAFKERDKGVVSISIKKSENKVTLIIQDNGIGIDEGIPGSKSSGFGLTIVKMLVEQLNGTYSIVNENGTKSVIQFEV